MSDHVPGGRTERRSPPGRVITGLAVAVKGVCGVLLALLVLQSWSQLDELENRRDVAEKWSDTRDFGVFYPHSIGDDRTEFDSGGHGTKATEAGELYPVLEEDGAVFVDAGNYAPGVPRDSILPVPPIRVNINYLDHYPILDESGDPIDIDRDERAWVVAIPEKFKAREAEIREFFRASRVGGQGIDGAVQGQERMLGEPVPDRFRDQDVRLVWAASDQEVFSFNSTVNPESGNMIVDPIVEIMTPANSLTVDRLNAITGRINTALKVPVDGDPESTLRDLTPTLRELNLDDNLRHLVTANEAALRELNEIRRAIAWTTAIAGGALLVMLALSAALVLIVCDRLRRTLTIRRLHGFGFPRTYRELCTLLGATWIGQALVAGTVVVLRGLNPGPVSGSAGGPFAELPQLLAVLAVASAIELLFVVVTASALERRNTVKRLKEL